MGGICGLMRPGEVRSTVAAMLRLMQSSLAHRGPNGIDKWVESGAGLAATYLMAEGSRTLLGVANYSNIRIVLDGQIHNLEELKTVLLRLGHSLPNGTPSELLIAAYLEFGEGFIGKIEGTFALALYDPRQRQLILARDPLGSRPLFYEATPSELYFGSEIKAILVATGRRPTVSLPDLQEYLIFRYNAGERTFIDGIRRVPPGHYAIWREGELHLQRYWTPPLPVTRADLSEAEVISLLDTHLTRAVGTLTAHSARLGTFCSGGIDSGVITGYTAKTWEGPLPTFSVGFEDLDWDETTLARDTAARFGTDHHAHLVHPAEFAGALPQVIRQNDEPLSHPNTVALFLLGQSARSAISTVLAGEGADELFGGYPRYQIARLHSALRPLPGWSRRGLASLSRLVPTHRAARLADLLPLSLEDSILYNSAFLSPTLVSRLTGSPIMDALEQRHRLLEESLVPGDPIASISRFELQSYLGSALSRLDITMMASGLESRLPFLDLQLVEWACRLESAYKVRGRESKYILRMVARRMLSNRVISGRKSGFGVPLASWFRTPEFYSLINRLRDPSHPGAALFDRQVLEHALHEHLAAKVDWSELLWLITNVYIWHEVNGL